MLRHQFSKLHLKHGATFICLLQPELIITIFQEVKVKSDGKRSKKKKKLKHWIEFKCSCFILVYRTPSPHIQKKFWSWNNNKITNEREKKIFVVLVAVVLHRKNHSHLINNNSRWWSPNKMERNASASIHKTPNARNEIILVSHQRLFIFDSTSFIDSKPFWTSERVKCSQRR